VPLIGNVTEFCTYFIVQKCFMNQEERKIVVQCMIELVSFLVAKGYIPEDEEAKETISVISPGLTFQSGTIQQKLNELWANDYWRKLQEVGSSKKVKTDNSDVPHIGTTLEPYTPWTMDKNYKQRLVTF
jgi:hypothetical protein